MIGEGQTSGKPSVQFKTNAAAAALFSMSSANIDIRNIYFPQGVQSNSITKISWGGQFGRIVGCYFDCGPNDVQGQLSLAGSDQMRISGCTFISTATVTTAQPGFAIRSTGALADLEIADTVFSAGTVGFSGFSAVDVSAGAATRVRMTGISLLLGADVIMGASATGYVNVQLSTGGSRVAWG
jgi:hypothetical protein